MDRGQKEVTDKIRSAIKKKLTQMNAFVDDELPEYIMILVANKRSKTYIEKDLSLFLGSETAEFSRWLDNLLNSLKLTSGNVTSSANARGIGAKKDSLPPSKGGIPEDDEDVIALDPQELEGDFLSQELINEEVYVPEIVQHVKETRNEKKPDPISVVKSVPAMKSVQPTLPSKERIVSKQAKVYPILQTPKTSVSSSVVPVKRSFVPKSDEYDPLNPSVNVSSVIHVTERKFSVPASIQANKLLLRAVDDATKSVLGGKDINEFYKPTPIKVLTSDRQPQDPLFKNNYDSNEFDYKEDFESNSDNSIFLPFDASTISTDSEEYDKIQEEHEASYLTFNKNMFQNVPPPANRRFIRSNVSSDALQDDTDTNKEANQVRSSDVNEDDSETGKRPSSPHFIVTLEGMDLKTLKRKRENSNIDLNMDYYDENESSYEDEELLDCDEMEVDYAPKKQKTVEKCRYWPACKSGNQCSYHHPQVPCKLFPKCKYGGTCLYIHPNCKFDALCSKKECPYTHASKRKLSLKVVKPALYKKKKIVSQTVCRFFPNCTSKTCQFFHPKLCRYGRDCLSSTCSYSHLNLPSRNQMKWHA